MKTKLITITFVLITVASYSQDASEYDEIEGRIVSESEYESNEYNLSPFSNLQVAPKANLENIILLKISELYSLGRYFKYHKELEEGNYRIDVLKDDRGLNVYVDGSSPNDPHITHNDLDTASLNKCTMWQLYLVENKIARCDPPTFCSYHKKIINDSLSDRIKNYLLIPPP